MAQPLLLVVTGLALVAAFTLGVFAAVRVHRRRQQMAQARERLRRLEEEAAQEERRRRQARMTHDLKAPIHALIGMADLLAESDLSEPQRKHLGTLRTSAEMLLALIRDILDLERLESGALKVRAEDFHLRPWVAETVSLFLRESEARGIEIRTQISADLPDALRGDPLRIRQVLMNLLSNAVKFTPAREESGGGEIVVEVAPATGGKEGEYWTCAVTDQGVGMSPETVERLFQPFSQADTTLVRTGGGSGLGLAICRHLLMAMGGEICCESVRGQGSTFHFTLPLVHATARDAEAPGAPGERFQGRVLVVDDEAVNRQIARAHLEALGVEVAEAVGGLEALELLAKEDWDVVLTDIRMPGVDGLALARRLRRREQEEGRRTTPLIAVTAQGEEQVADESRAGLNDRLSKPYRRADLAALLRRWLPSEGGGQEVEIEPAVRPWQATRAALEALSQKTGEDEVAKAVASFQESAALHLEAMESAWQAQDWERIRDPLHSLSGTAEFLGGAAVVATAAEIRRHIDMGNRMEGALLGRLRREIDETALRCLQDGSNAPDHEEGGSGQQQAEKG